MHVQYLYIQSKGITKYEYNNVPMSPKSRSYRLCVWYDLWNVLKINPCIPKTVHTYYYYHMFHESWIPQVSVWLSLDFFTYIVRFNSISTAGFRWQLSIISSTASVSFRHQAIIWTTDNHDHRYGCLIVGKWIKTYYWSMTLNQLRFFW